MELDPVAFTSCRLTRATPSPPPPPPQPSGTAARRRAARTRWCRRRGAARHRGGRGRGQSERRGGTHARASRASAHAQPQPLGRLRAQKGVRALCARTAGPCERAHVRTCAQRVRALWVRALCARAVGARAARDVSERTRVSRERECVSQLREGVAPLRDSV
jgi:hypothetical protein